jgi:uncharacterized protein YukE
MRRESPDLEEFMAAAREERAARAALEAGIGPLDQNWCESDEEAYQARLARWRTASRTLVDGLNRLNRRTASVESSR